MRLCGTRNVTCAAPSSSVVSLAPTFDTQHQDAATRTRRRVVCRLVSHTLATRPSRRCFELPGSSGRAHTSHLFRPTTHAHTPVLTHRTTQTDHTPTSHPSTPEFIANVHGQRKRRTNKREARRVRALTSRLLWHAHLGTPTRLICSIPNSFMHATLS